MRGIDETIDAIEALLAAGEPNAVIERAERARRRRARSSTWTIPTARCARSSNGSRIQLTACRRGKPDPTVLAERLLHREVGGEWDPFDRAAIR